MTINQSINQSIKSLLSFYGNILFYGHILWKYNGLFPYDVASFHSMVQTADGGQGRFGASSIVMTFYKEMSQCEVEGLKSVSIFSFLQ